MQFDDNVICKVYKNNRGDGGFKRSWDDEPRNIDINASTSASKIPKLQLNPVEAKAQFIESRGMQLVEEFTNYEYNPFVNIPHRLQNQQQQPIVQMLQVSSACAVFPQNNLQVLPPAGADAIFHRDSKRLWNDQWANDASSSSSKIPKLQLN